MSTEENLLKIIAFEGKSNWFFFNKKFLKFAI